MIVSTPVMIATTGVTFPVTSALVSVRNPTMPKTAVTAAAITITAGRRASIPRDTTSLDSPVSANANPTEAASHRGPGTRLVALDPS